MNSRNKSLKRGLRFAGCLLIIGLLVGYEYWALSRPLPLLKPTLATTPLSVQAVPSTITWPAAGQAASSLLDTTLLHTNGQQKPAPIASTAKIITALSVLHIKPLALGQQGPMLTMTASDVALYNSYVAKGGSVVPVQAGEQISEYQVLQTMLLPSANNMADGLASWAYGSLSAYAAAANAYLAQLGLTATHVGSDASGFDPSTTSTAIDLVKLGKLTMQNPVLAQIVGQTSADDIPLVGTIKNVNFLLGTNNIIGIKTGNTDQAGGVFLSASTTVENNKTLTVVTALVGAPTLYQAMATSLPLIRTAQADFTPVTVVSKGAIVGSYKQPWGGAIPAIASRDLIINTAKGSSVSATVKLLPTPVEDSLDHVVGNVYVPSTTIYPGQVAPVTLQTAPTKPSTWWRLLHPF